MILPPILGALIIAALLTLVFTLFPGKNGIGRTAIFFVILFLVMWAGHFWLVPYGPYFWGISWLPLLFIGLLTALLLTIGGADTRRRNPKEHHTPNPRDAQEHNVVIVSEEDRRDAFAATIVFLTLIGVLIIAIIVGFMVS